ncbi:MAG: hypothetical protein ACYCY7_08640 [Gallionella sp.]
MKQKQKQELEFTRRFLADTEFQITRLVSGDRPDIIAVTDDRNIGIEVTVFHVDEGSPRLLGEDTLRQEGEENARLNLGQPYTMAVPLFPYTGLEARINDKIAKAQQYDLGQTDELWLLVSAQVPSLGALPATYVIPFLVDTTKLNGLFHDKLLASRFSHVYLHLIFDHAIFGWDRSGKWQVVRTSRELDTSGREALDMLRQTYGR